MPSNSMCRWEAGDTVVFRGVWHGKIWYACAVTVVQDTPDLIALYWQAGTPNFIPPQRPVPQDLLSNNISLVSHAWVDTDVLLLATPGASHSVSVMWETGQRQLRCWYVDLQEPLRRTAVGFDTMDHLLDVVISADQSAWRWKDEDEFEEAVRLEVYSPEEARAIRLEGERVIMQFQAGEPPFNAGWEKWSPPPGWRIPEFPDGWKNITSLCDQENQTDGI